jgi:hypothetical protein
MLLYTRKLRRPSPRSHHNALPFGLSTTTILPFRSKGTLSDQFMADRLPQYSMLPSNFNSNLLQQQISQSQVDPQSLPAFPNSENNRGWQNQYRSQPGANISGSQQVCFIRLLIISCHSETSGTTPAGRLVGAWHPQTSAINRALRPRLTHLIRS